MRWIVLLADITLGFIVAVAETVARPRPSPPLVHVWLSDGDGPLMHVGAMTAADAWRATVGR